MTPEERKAIEAELAEHTAYRALLAAAERASAAFVDAMAEAHGGDDGDAEYDEESKAWGAVIMAARERARKELER